MTGFVSLFAPADRAGPLDRLSVAPPPGWRADLIQSGWVLLRRATRPPAVQRLGDGTLVVGALFSRRIKGEVVSPASGALAFDTLLTEAWGGYVAMRREGEGGPMAVLRDPSGTLEAAVWRRDGVEVVASELPDGIDPWLPRGIGLDLGRVAALLAAPGLAGGLSPLAGIEVLAPGAVWREGLVEQAWRPSVFAGRTGRQDDDRERELAAEVDGVAAALGQGRGLVEISGGLDSAIVAAALRATGAEIVGAVTYFVEDGAGDERLYARDVARRLGLGLTEVLKPETPLDLDALLAASRGLRPALWAVDAHHDADLAARAADLRADALFTGQGGDNVFFQTPTPLIAADGLRGGLTIRALSDLARWQGRSVYGLAREAIRGLGRSPLETAEAGLAHLGPAARALAGLVPGHPWLRGMAVHPPAKQLQIASLLGAVSAHGPSRRATVADLRRPLLSQPLLEFGLSVPTLQLTRGGRDRGLARDAFAGRLPASVLARRAKGRLSAHYGQVVARSLADLRPLLLDGRLVAEGLLDRDALDGLLTVETLIWRGGLGVIIQALMFELWVRAWEGRPGVSSQTAEGNWSALVTGGV